MGLLDSILRKVLLYEAAVDISPDKVISAIDNREKIIVTYLSDGKDRWKGPRQIEIYAYGITKAGNPVIRAFQQYGDSKKRIYKGWKFFRLDRIMSWRNTGQTFEAHKDFGQYGNFNPEGDKTMAQVYHILKLDNTDVNDPTNTLKPKMKAQTATEKGLERLKMQLANPIYLKDIQKKPTAPTSGPRTKPETQKPSYTQQQQQQKREPDIDKLSDEFYKDYERKVGRQQAERDRRALGITGQITPEKLKNAQGAVDRMKKYRKGSGNEFIRSLSDDILKKIMDKMAEEEQQDLQSETV